MTKPTLHIDAAMPISRKVQIIQDFLGEHFFDDTGLFYAMWYWKGEELRPFRLDDFEGYSYPSSSDGFTPRGHQNNEDSAMNCGNFLLSQCLRYQATKDEQALEYAAKAFRSIDYIFKLTEAQGHKGYVCKPYDGQVSKETSPDQYFGVMVGLWQYRALAEVIGEKYAKERIDYLLPAMADWWRERNYSIKFFDMDMKGSDHNPGHNPGFTALHQMAYLITGNPVYLNEAQRLIAIAGTIPTYYEQVRNYMLVDGIVDDPGFLEGFEYDHQRRRFLTIDQESRVSTWMVVAPYPFFMRHDLSRIPMLKSVLGRMYKHMQYGLRDDLLSYYTIQVDLERDIWRPVKVPSTPERLANAPYGNWHFCSYYSEVCWPPNVARLGYVSVIAHQYAPEMCPGALDLARRILQRLDSPRLQSFLDPDGQQLLPPDEWMQYCFYNDPAAHTLLAYWTARVAGIDL